MSGREKFQSDLTTLIERLTYNTTPTVEAKLGNLTNWLIALHYQIFVYIKDYAFELV